MILDETLRGFARALAEARPVPGGGSAAEYTGALGAALAGMAIAYSLKRKGLDEPSLSLLEEGARRMERLRERFLLLSEEDCAAYGAFSQALGLPRDTREEKALRRARMKEALEGALAVPLEGAGLCLEGLSMLASLAEILSPRLITDAGVAARCFQAAFHSCWYNVRVNANGLKDEGRLRALSEQEKGMAAQVEGWKGKVLDVVDRVLKG